MGKDLKKVERRTGTYNQKVRNYNLDEKRQIKQYKELHLNITKDGKVVPTKLSGEGANMAQIARSTESASWRATTKPYGVIAEKRVRM